jgi:hypothetical protein
VSLSPDKAKSIQFDNNKISRTPDSKLISYVLPGNLKTPGYGNDQRVIKEPGDIKNPIGTKHTDDTFRTRDKDNNDRTVIKTADKDDDSNHRTKIDKNPGPDNSKRNPPPNSDKDRKPTEIKKAPTVSPYQYDRKGFDNGKDHPGQADRDSQFQRNPTKTYQGVSPYQGSDSPYYRYGNFDDDRKGLVPPGRNSDGNPYRRTFDPNSDRNPYDSKKEISPRYLDEAKKFFDKFDGNRQGVSRDNQPDNSGYKGSNPPSRVDTKRNNNNSSRTTTNSRPPSSSKPSSNDKKPPR